MSVSHIVQEVHILDELHNALITLVGESEVILIVIPKPKAIFRERER